MSKPRQQTIQQPAEIAGVGLHTGEPVRLRVLPAAENSGIRFRRTDLDGAPEVPAKVERVLSTDRGTTLGEGEVRIHTVEHLLATVAALRIDNLLIELDAAEVPVADGSALPFANLLGSAGVREQAPPAHTLQLREPLCLREGSTNYVVAPSAEFQVTASIAFEHPRILRQTGSYRVTPEVFREELAFARTFGFVHEVEVLRERGLARGGTPENAVVLTEDGLLEGIELRAPDEFVRHKALDLIGDLALCGARLTMHVVAEQPSHRGNVALARELLSRAEQRATASPILDIQQILQYLPHRYPFLLVDRVVEFEERKRIVGIKNVTINEPFFVGHFPGRPVMPGVLIIEAMAQVGGLLLLETIENLEDKIVYFMSLDHVKWRRPVTPGDQIRFEIDVLQIRGTTCRMRGVGTVDGAVVAEAEMMARVVDR